MTVLASRLVCGGCGASPSVDDPSPFRCPRAGVGDVDHVLVRLLDPELVRFPRRCEAAVGNPFVRYRELLHSYHRALAGGMTDRAFVDMVDEIDRAIADVDGTGFRATPFSRSDVLSEALHLDGGGAWVKDETGNVAGSHKGRHLMGVLLHLEVAERLGATPTGARRAPLAIASCGNAALAAAVLAKATGRRLHVFVPDVAPPATMDRLVKLGADVVVCERTTGERGDPSYLELQRAIAGGAIPFTCQGNENGLVIEGGETLAYEMATDLALARTDLDHLVLQVGGGALASACIQGLREAVAMGALARLPMIWTVQTAGAHPLERAHAAVRARLRGTSTPDRVAAAVADAAQHRSTVMWPWEHEPRSIATGILDDETYDWRAIVEGMLVTGGGPLVVSEDRLAEAHELGHAAGYPVEPTGTAGLAGLLDLAEAGTISPNQRVAVLFTGVDR